MKPKGYKDTPSEITLFTYVEAYFHDGDLVVLDDMSEEQLASKKAFHAQLRKSDKIFSMKRRATVAEMEEYEKELAEEEAEKVSKPPPRPKGVVPIWSF